MLAGKRNIVSGIIMPLMRFIGNIGYVFVAVVGGIMVTQNAISIGDVQAFIQYAQQFTQPITMLANIANVIQSAMASAERIFELLDEEEQVPEAADALTIENPEGAVQFEHVRFGYSEDNILMEDMNIDVQAWPDDRDCRSDWCRQNNPGQSADALLRGQWRQDSG